MDATTSYAVKVVHDAEYREMCCKWEILACERHLNDLKRQEEGDFLYIFDTTRAERVFKFMAILKRKDAPSKYLELEDWQKFDLGATFGWVHKETGARRFNTSYNRIARGNGKTAVAGGNGNYGMCSDAIYPPYKPELAEYEHSPEVVVVAVDAVQANRAYNDIKVIGENSPAIAARLDIKSTYIKHKTRGGSVEKFSKDTRNKDGGRPSMVIVEEYHAHPNNTLRDVAKSSMGKTRQSLEYIITTAGTDAENKPCYREDQNCKRILLEELILEHVFVMIREIDDGDNPHDKSCWVKANPFFRRMDEYAKTLYDIVEKQHKEAFESNDPDKIREFMIKRMNRWQADSEHKYMSGIMELWKKLAVDRSEFYELTKGIKGFRGLDLSKRVDLTADAFVGWLPDGRLAVSAFGFIPEESAGKHEHTDRVPYKEWARDGWCEITPGAVTDYNFVKRHIFESEENHEWDAKEICYDPYNASHLMQEFEVTGYIPVEIRQGVMTLSEPTKRFRELVLQEKIVHDGSPLLTWCLSNAIEVLDSNGNTKLSKKHKDDSQRIDLIAAVINAMVRALKSEVAVDMNRHILSEGFSL